MVERIRQAVREGLTGSPIPVEITTEAMGEWLNSSPVVTAVEKQHERQFLKGITGADNEFTATINWRQAAPGTVRFQHGAEAATEDAMGDTAKHTFDMGNDGDAVIVTAIGADGENSDPFQVDLIKVTVPPWASPAGLQASGCIA